MPVVTSACPDMTTRFWLHELGLEVAGQCLETDCAVLACRVLAPDAGCRRCGCQGVPRDAAVRQLAHEPFEWRPTTLEVTIHGYRCAECAHVWRQDSTAAAAPRAKPSWRAERCTGRRAGPSGSFLGRSGRGGVVAGGGLVSGRRGV